jgi:tetratricopeptide (TPR) repeat protein
MAHVTMSNFRKAIDVYKQAFEIYQKLHKLDEENRPPTAELLEYYRNFGLFYTSLSEIESARDNFVNALEVYDTLYAEKSGSYHLLQVLLERLVSCYGSLGDFQKAVKYQHRLLDLKKKVSGDKDDKEIANLLSYIGTSYQNLGEPKKGLTFKLESYEMMKRLTNGEDSEDMVMILLSITTNYHILNELEQTLSYCNMALNMNKRIHADADHLQTAEALTCLGNLTEQH